jgi:hypothetical protein
MSQGLVASFLLVHGLITSAIGLGTVSNPAAPAMTLPSWFSWWPGPFGRSWLFEALGLGSGAAVLGGLIWVAAGLALIAGALGWFGLSALTELRVPLLVGGAALSLVALAIYFHPIYVLAVVINLAIVALLWGRLAAGAAV